MKLNKRRLRVCASCEWIFMWDENSSCPRCHFAHYGAHYVYGSKAYKYQYTQTPWKKRVMEKIEYNLDKFIEKQTKSIRKKRETNKLNQMSYCKTIGCPAQGTCVSKEKWNHRAPSPIEKAARELDFGIIYQAIMLSNSPAVDDMRKQFKNLMALERAVKEAQ